jgi:hypothetical protein
VVKVDMGEEDGVEVRDAEAMLVEALTERRESGGGAGVDEGVVTIGFEQSGSDGVRVVNPVEVKKGDGGHGDVV